MMAVMAVAALTASAQKGDFYITPHLGLGYAHVTDFTDYEGNISGIVGADFEIMMTNTLGLSAGLDYEYIRSFTTTYGTKDMGIDTYATYSYFNIPVLLQYHFGEGWAIKAGVQPMLNLAADFNVDGKNVIASGDVSKLQDSFKDGINKFMLAVPVGVSYTFQDTPIVVDLRANIPTGKMFDGDGKLLDFVVSVGYCFDL